jgi:hypothetical protein
MTKFAAWKSDGKIKSIIRRAYSVLFDESGRWHRFLSEDSTAEDN